MLLHCPGGCKVAQLWYRRLAKDARALAFLNLSDQPLGKLCIQWAEVGWMPRQTAQVTLFQRFGDQVDCRFLCAMP